MMLSVLLLSMFMILLSTLNVARHLICGNKSVTPKIVKKAITNLDFGPDCIPVIVT